MTDTGVPVVFIDGLELHAVTDLTELPGRGHLLTIGSGWREVADTGLTEPRNKPSLPGSTS